MHTPRMNQVKVFGSLTTVVAAVAIASADVTQSITPTKWHYRATGICDFDQDRVATGNVPGLPLGGNSHCAPTAVADILAYLATARVGGIWGIPLDDWDDYDASEYSSANAFINTCGILMGTNTGGVNGTATSRLSDAAVWYLPADEYSVLLLGRGPGGGLPGMTTTSIVSAVASPLIPRPVCTLCVSWLQPAPGVNVWTITGGHCFVLTEAIRKLPSGQTELDIRDPADSDLINPNESTSAQSPFTTAIYNAVDGVYQAGPGGPAWTMSGAWMQGFFSAGGTRGIVKAQQLVMPTTLYTADWTGLQLRMVRPIRFEYESQDPVQPFATGLSSALTDIAFDFTSQGVYAILGSGTGASLVRADGIASSVSPVSIASSPRFVTAGRLGEVFVAGTNGAVNTLTRVPTGGSGTPTSRTLALAPDALCYDDASDRVFAYHSATRTLYAIPRLEAEAIVTSTVPASAQVSGDVSMAINPADGSLWLAGSGVAGKFYKITLSASGGASAAAGVSSSAIVSPRGIQHLGNGKVVFQSGGSLRVLTENATTGAWEADASSSLWGAVAASAFDISRRRNNLLETDPAWDLVLDETPTSTPVTRETCVADLTLDGLVDGADFSILLSEWGGDGFGDLDRSDVVDGVDLGLMLSAWGVCP